MLRNTMANFETKLDPDVFLRIHRSAIVNLQHVKEFRTDGNDGECFVTMSDGHKLPVSRGTVRVLPASSPAKPRECSVPDKKSQLWTTSRRHLRLSY